MLRWLATLNYRTIKERAAQFAGNADLIGQPSEPLSPPAADPKEAVYSVCLSFLS